MSYPPITRPPRQRRWANWFLVKFCGGAWVPAIPLREILTAVAEHRVSPDRVAVYDLAKRIYERTLHDLGPVAFLIAFAWCFMLNAVPPAAKRPGLVLLTGIGIGIGLAVYYTGWRWRLADYRREATRLLDSMKGERP